MIVVAARPIHASADLCVAPLAFARDRMAVTHAFQLIPSPPAEPPPLIAVFGSDATLRGWSIRAICGDADVTSYDGAVVRWTDLKDELATASLFDFDGMRTIVVRDADRFVSDHRAELEAYAAKPSSANRFVLELESLAANTRLYKAIAAKHLVVPCGAGVDAKQGVTAATRRKFLSGYVAGRHGVKLAAAAADALIEMLGEEIGMLDTEIAKLALYLEPGGTIEEATAREIVAGWQGKTVWQITDAIAAGDAAEALRQLDKLMSGGQRPIALLPQIAWSLRRLGMATAVVQYRERTGRGWNLDEALGVAGVRRPADVQRSNAQLKGLGRDRAKRLLPWLLDADLRLKGTHSQDGRDRFLLEQLVLKLARAAGG